MVSLSTCFPLRLQFTGESRVVHSGAVTLGLLWSFLIIKFCAKILLLNRFYSAGPSAEPMLLKVLSTAQIICCKFTLMPYPIGPTMTRVIHLSSSYSKVVRLPTRGNDFEINMVLFWLFKSLKFKHEAFSQTKYCKRICGKESMIITNKQYNKTYFFSETRTCRTVMYREISAIFSLLNSGVTLWA